MKTFDTCFKLILVFVLIAIGTLVFSNQANAQLRAIPDPMAAVQINSYCEGDQAVFKLRNIGEKWREIGEIILISQEQRQIVSRRKMRLASGQSATFRVPTVKLGAEGPVHMFLVAARETNKPLAKATLKCVAS